MRVWVTRAEPGAAVTAERLAALGHDPVVAPLLRIEAIDAAIDPTGVAALAFTSVNGVTAFAGLSPARDLPVYAVGDATAAAATQAGFARVVSAAGAVADLAATIVAAHDPATGAVLWVGAEAPAGDLAGLLAAGGVTLRSRAVYRAVATSRPDLAAALKAGDIAAVLLHSPRAAVVLAALLPPGPIPAVAVAISEAAAAPLAAAGFDRIAVAARPDEASLLAALGKAGPRV